MSQFRKQVLNSREVKSLEGCDVLKTILFGSDHQSRNFLDFVERSTFL
jgi:hypothetical protein